MNWATEFEALSYGPRKTKMSKCVLYTSVSQPPGRVPAPGLAGRLTGTWNIFETLKLKFLKLKFIINKVQIIELSQKLWSLWNKNEILNYTFLVFLRKNI